jgi:hypothetical protein
MPSSFLVLDGSITGKPSAEAETIVELASVGSPSLSRVKR